MSDNKMRRYGVVATSLVTAISAFSALARSHDQAAVWLTTADQTHLAEREPDIGFKAAPAGNGAPILVVDPSRRFQVIEGFGAAMTDASAYVLRHDLNAVQRRAAIGDLFGNRGLRLNFVRLTIGSSDFSPRDISYDDMPKGQRDPELAHFSLDPAREDLLPVLREALTINPQLHFLASPWSAPGWMKTSGSMIGGTLRADAYDGFARYLTLYVAGMAHERVPIAALTVQNEPG